ncbi:MAG: hypothetical protein HONBIEJF_01734 [Fimbriimonadaceae bacterium]|nr:hypothetical protein [Fimbriimonadaceae bacterium]
MKPKVLTYSAIALLGATLAGCQGRKPEDTSTGKDQVTVKADEATVPKPAPPTPEGKRESVMNEAAKETGVDPAKIKEFGTKPMPIKPIAKAGTKGWKGTDLSPKEIGKKIDDAIANLKQLDGGGLLLLDIPEGKGEARTALKVVNPSKYMIQYNIVPTLSENHTLVADGEAKAEAFRQQWTNPMPIDAKGKAWEASTIVERWPEEFQRIMFMPLADRQPVWEKLLTGLQRGDSGYRSKLEKQDFTWKGHTKPYYRVVATRPTDKAEMEIFVDGVAFVPLTIIVKREVEGKPHKVQWQAQWKFGASWEDKWFVIPTKPKS